ncbi:hypothetical protein [Azospirillum largimobile]
MPAPEGPARRSSMTGGPRIEAHPLVPVRMAGGTRWTDIDIALAGGSCRGAHGDGGTGRRHPVATAPPSPSRRRG